MSASSSPFSARSRREPAVAVGASEDPRPWARAWIGLGSNLGERRALLEEAVGQISALRGVRWRRLSRVRETEPVGGPPQGAYLNAVGELDTVLSPRELLERLLAIEAVLGRVREERFGPRTIDLDLLLFDDRVIEEDGLQVPHPRLAERAFVLEPLAELAAEVEHPVLGVTVAELWRRLQRVDEPETPGESRAHPRTRR